MKNPVLIAFLIFSNFLQAQNEIFDSLTIELNQYKLNHPKNSEDKRVFNLLENLYEEVLQTNKGLSQETLNKYREIDKSDSVLNKSIFFLFKKYQDYITETVAQGKSANWNIQLAIMKLLAGECIESYGEIPTIVVVYMGEALMSAGMNEKAIEHFEMSKEFYPDSIPIKVYLVLLDEEKYKKLKKELIKTYENHWMVKEKLIKE